MNGTALKLLRQYHQLKGVELAAALDISSSNISGFENTGCEIPITALEKYATYFRVPTSSILALAEALESDEYVSLEHLPQKLQRVYGWWVYLQAYKETQ